MIVVEDAAVRQGWDHRVTPVASTDCVNDTMRAAMIDSIRRSVSCSLILLDLRAPPPRRVLLWVSMG